MRIYRALFGLIVFGAIATNTPAFAKVEEIRGGVFYHNLPTSGKNGGKEKGPDIALQIGFSKLESWTWLAKPEPIVTLNLNTQSETSFAAIGFNWDFPINENWAFSPSFGYAIHNADPLVNPYQPWQSVERRNWDLNEIEFNSRDQFWTSLAFERKLDNDTSLYLAFEHLSHGQILGEGQNQGLSNLGVLWAKKF